MSLPERVESNVLERRPIIDMIEPQMLKLIKATVASDQGITDAEVGYFLELAAQYQLDPFAREVWIAKSKSGKLLIMVGRDGLRRIASRNGIHVDSDVVHENDEFSVTRLPNGDRAITHSWTVKDRGGIVGAWAECREKGPKGRPLGFFYAPLEEFKPKDVSGYSPWAKQVSPMITGAAERQAIRKATPLGGLLFDGEQFLADEAVAIGSGEGDGSPPGWEGLSDERVEEVEALISMAEAFGVHLDLGSVQMRLNSQPDEVVEAWLVDTRESLAKKAPDEKGGES